MFNEVENNIIYVQILDRFYIKKINVFVNSEILKLGESFVEN